MLHSLARVSETARTAGQPLDRHDSRAARSPPDSCPTKSVESNHRFRVRRMHSGRMFTEQRGEPREAVALPLKLGDGSAAVTRDISPSGMYLQIRGCPDLRGTLLFEMDLQDLHMKFTAQGHVVRLEHCDGYTGIAVKLDSPRLEPLA
jgi:hypothetical protein